MPYYIKEPKRDHDFDNHHFLSGVYVALCEVQVIRTSKDGGERLKAGLLHSATGTVSRLFSGILDTTFLVSGLLMYYH